MKTPRAKKTSRAKKAVGGAAWKAALSSGSGHAKSLVARYKSARRGVPRRAAPVLLVAEGDSWFDYPFHDVLESLEDDFQYRVESVAHKGDTVEGMAYDENQLNGLCRLLMKLGEDRRIPKAILLSAGGNDIAGDELAVLLNHKKSHLPSLNENVVAGVIDERLRFAIVTVAKTVTELSRAAFGRVLPILTHGYDYPVPDGRGYAGGAFFLPGPWLEPSFRKKGYQDLAERALLMRRLIDRFNATVAAVAGGPGLEHLRYVNLRGTLSPETPRRYKEWWNDELHPTGKGFKEVARKFFTEIERVG